MVPDALITTSLWSIWDTSKPFTKITSSDWSARLPWTRQPWWERGSDGDIVRVGVVRHDKVSVVFQCVVIQ